MYANTFLEKIHLNKRTYSLNFAYDMENHLRSYDFYEEVFYGSKLPEITQFTDVCAHPIVNVNIEEYVTALVYLENDPRCVPEITLLDGRLFSEEELANGSDVIILSEQVNYFRTETPYQLGDFIQINEIPYEIIGLCNGHSYITENNVMKRQNFLLTVGSILFSDILSAEEEQNFARLCSVVGANPVTRYSEAAPEFAMQVVGYVIIILLILYCALTIIVQLFDFMVKSRRYEYNIYKVLGISEGMLFFVYYTPISLISLISVLAGYGIYGITEKWQGIIGMEQVLSMPVVAAVGCVIVAVLFATTISNYLELRKQHAVETR